MACVHNLASDRNTSVQSIFHSAIAYGAKWNYWCKLFIYEIDLNNNLFSLNTDCVYYSKYNKVVWDLSDKSVNKRPKTFLGIISLY